MGMWNFEAWENDSAADWFGELMDGSEIRSRWLAGLNNDPEEEHEVVRAAVWLFAQLGRVYIWPIEKYGEDLEAAVKAGERLVAVEWLREEAPEYIEKLEADLEQIKARRKGDE